jgi:quercetin dioxygenase-like cupin family protein
LYARRIAIEFALFQESPMDHPSVFRPEEHAVYDSARMGKATLFQSDRLLVGLNAFEPGQEHSLHTHAGMDKVYHVLAGRGVFLLEGREQPMEAGVMLIAPEGVPHGIRNTGEDRLLVLAILAPSPQRLPHKP